MTSLDCLQKTPNNLHYNDTMNDTSQMYTNCQTKNVYSILGLCVINSMFCCLLQKCSQADVFERCTKTRPQVSNSRSEPRCIHTLYLVPHFWAFRWILELHVAGYVFCPFKKPPAFSDEKVWYVNVALLQYLHDPMPDCSTEALCQSLFLTRDYTAGMCKPGVITQASGHERQSAGCGGLGGGHSTRVPFWIAARSWGGLTVSHWSFSDYFYGSLWQGHLILAGSPLSCP